MTDRELLEAAAKAAGIDAEFHPELGFGPEGMWLKGQRSPDNSKYWNPLNDDGDALRLAVKLRISLIHEQEYMGGPVVETIEATGPVRPDGSRHCEMLSLNDTHDDPMTNTRRCIVRAAAAMAGQPSLNKMLYKSTA